LYYPRCAPESDMCQHDSKGPKHDPRCESADPLSRCRCSCGGSLHGSRRENGITPPESEPLGQNGSQLSLGITSGPTRSKPKGRRMRRVSEVLADIGNDFATAAYPPTCSRWSREKRPPGCTCTPWRAFLGPVTGTAWLHRGWCRGAPFAESIGVSGRTSTAARESSRSMEAQLVLHFT